MAEDDERRGQRAGSRRRDSARSQRPTAPLIEATGEPSSDPIDPPSPDPIEAAAGSEFGQPESSTVAPEAYEPNPPGLSGATYTSSDAPVSDDVPSRDPGMSSRRDRPKPSIVPAVAALVVAILGAGWIYLYNQLSVMQSDGQNQVADLRSKIAALESRPMPDVDGLAKRVDTSVAQVQERLQVLTHRIDEMPTSGSDPKQNEAVQAEVNDLKKSISDLQSAVANVPKPDLSGVDQRIGDLGQGLTALQAAVGAIPHTDLGPLTQTVNGLETRLKPIEAEAEAARSPQRVAERQAAPVAVTAQAIVDAIASGRSFPRELAALEALGADPAKVAPLQTVASGGAPSLSDLRANLAELRDSMVGRGTPKPSGSYMDRLMAGAGALVQVRPLGSVVGDTPAAMVARMDDAISADDLSRALHEWESLPEESRSVSKGLADRIRMRLEAETAAKAIAANAIGAMAPPRG